MPANVVKSMAREGKGTEGELEAKWNRAVEQAEKQGKGDNYAYIMGIFKKMTSGKSKKSALEILCDTVSVNRGTALELLLNRKQAEIAAGDIQEKEELTEEGWDTLYPDTAATPMPTPNVAARNTGDSTPKTFDSMGQSPQRNPSMFPNRSNSDSIGNFFPLSELDI